LGGLDTTWRQPAALNGLSRFLVAHEPCGVGFDVSHPAGLGSGRVSMTCRGCGATYEYATGTIEFEREIEFEPVAVAESAFAAPTAAAATVALPQRVSAAPPEGGGRRRRPWRQMSRRTRDRAMVAGLLGFAIVALAFAAIRLTGGQGSSSAGAPAAAAGAPVRATAKPAPAQPSRQPPAKAATKPAEQKAATPAVKPATRPLAGEKQVQTPRFTLIVPRDWTRQAEGGGLLLSAPGGGGSVWAFYESNPQMSLEAMSGETARFLDSRVAAGTVAGPTLLRVDGHPAFEVSDRGPAISQTALGILAGPYRYLALKEVQAGAPASTRAAAARALRSFRPR
jgi:hypothetical protein